MRPLEEVRKLFKLFHDYTKTEANLYLAFQVPLKKTPKRTPFSELFLLGWLLLKTTLLICSLTTFFGQSLAKKHSKNTRST